LFTKTLIFVISQTVRVDALDALETFVKRVEALKAAQERSGEAVALLAQLGAEAGIPARGTRAGRWKRRLGGLVGMLFVFLAGFVN
jgi:hypothetical protein